MPWGCSLQVQEKCDYDLVTPLALLFYYAVLYVSPAACSSVPARGQPPGQGPCGATQNGHHIGVAFVCNATVCVDQFSSEKDAVNTRQLSHKLRDEKKKKRASGLLSFLFKDGLIRKGDG